MWFITMPINSDHHLNTVAQVCMSFTSQGLVVGLVFLTYRQEGCLVYREFKMKIIQNKSQFASLSLCHALAVLNSISDEISLPSLIRNMLIQV